MERSKEGGQPVAVDPQQSLQEIILQMRKCEKNIYQFQVRPENEKLALELSRNLQNLSKLTEKFHPSKEGNPWFKNYQQNGQENGAVSGQVASILSNSESNRERIELLRKYNAQGLKQCISNVEDYYLQAQLGLKQDLSSMKVNFQRQGQCMHQLLKEFQTIIKDKVSVKDQQSEQVVLFLSSCFDAFQVLSSNAFDQMKEVEEYLKKPHQFLVEAKESLEALKGEFYIQQEAELREIREQQRKTEVMIEQIKSNSLEYQLISHAHYEDFKATKLFKQNKYIYVDAPEMQIDVLNEDLGLVKTLDTEGNYLRCAVEVGEEFALFGCNKMKLYLFGLDTLSMMSSLKTYNGINTLAFYSQDHILVGEDDGQIEVVSYPYLHSAKTLTIQNQSDIFQIKTTSRKSSELVLATEKGLVFGELSSSLSFTESKKEQYLAFKCVRNVEEYKPDKFALLTMNDLEYVVLLDRNKKSMVKLQHPTGNKHWTCNMEVLGQLDSFLFVRDEFNITLVDLENGVASVLASNLQCSTWLYQMSLEFDPKTEGLQVYTIQLDGQKKDSKIVKLGFGKEFLVALNQLGLKQ